MGRFTQARKGITPVVAIVLLLMMTVAAAGGAYTWVTGIISQGQEEGTNTLNRQIEVMDISCTGSTVDFFLTNSGSTSVDANSVTIYQYDVSDGSLMTTVDSSNGNMAPGDDWDQTSGLSGFNSMTAGNEYRIEFEFDNENGYSVEGTCQAT